MPSLSKQILSRQKSSLQVVAVVDTHREMLLTKLTTRYGAAFAQQAVAVLMHLREDLAERTEEMLAVERVYQAELKDDGPVRAAVKTHAEALHKKLGTMRNRLKGPFGEAFVRELGIDGEHTRAPSGLLQLMGFLLQQMDRVKAPAADTPGMGYDAEEWALYFEPTYGLLKQGVADLVREGREADTALLDKDKAMDAYDEVFRFAAGQAGLCLMMAGEKELAKRVRPSGSKPGRTVEDDADKTSEDDDAKKKASDAPKGNNAEKKKKNDAG